MAALNLRTSRDVSSTAGRSSRGWQVLREHWRDFLDKRPGIPERVAAEVSHVDMSPQRASLSKEAADRIMDKIIHASQESPRAKATAETWKRARKLHYEVRAALGDGLKPSPAVPPPLEEQTLAGVGYAASALFPTEWWQALTPQLLADLVVDAFQGAFCDALLDGAVTLLETAEGWGRPHRRSLGGSASEPVLSPAAVLPGRAVPSSPSAARPGSSTPTGTLPGLVGPASTGESWTTKRYHACQQLDSLKGRIQRSTELQRPRRRIVRTGQEGEEDLRKFNWPMTATNFPEVWDRTTRPSRSKSSSGVGPRHGGLDRAPAAVKSGIKQDPWLLKVGRDGKTVFPYSLASHRAFLEAQPDPVLKEKAMKLAPLRMTGAW